MSVLMDGTVISSSQDESDAILYGRKAFGSMLGIILAVYAADDEDNSATALTGNLIGWRHECKVLIIDSDGQPYLLLDNVVIPPSSHSGIDNYDEDLPKGLNKEIIDGMNIKQFSGVDYRKLDAEWCVVDFIRDNLDKPYITNWWCHPINAHDPATKEADNLTQVDVNKNKFRKFRRINGSYYIVNKNGDLYINTTEANSKVEVTDASEITRRKEYGAGGSVQVDIKKTQQLEFNWNEPVVGLAAGSNSQTQSRDPSLPQPHKKSTVPPVRETSRTILRFKDYEGLIKTSSLNVNCKTVGEKLGQFVVSVDDTVLLMQGDETVAALGMQDGHFQLIAQDGSLINILDDEIQMLTAGGAMIDLRGSELLINGTVNAGGPVSIGGAGEPTILGEAYTADIKSLLDLLSTYLKAAATGWGAVTPAQPQAASAASAVVSMIDTNMKAKFTGKSYLAKNLTST